MRPWFCIEFAFQTLLCVQTNHLLYSYTRNSESLKGESSLHLSGSITVISLSVNCHQERSQQLSLMLAGTPSCFPRTIVLFNLVWPVSSCCRHHYHIRHCDYVWYTMMIRNRCNWFLAYFSFFLFLFVYYPTPFLLHDRFNCLLTLSWTLKG